MSQVYQQKKPERNSSFASVQNFSKSAQAPAAVSDIFATRAGTAAFELERIRIDWERAQVQYDLEPTLFNQSKVAMASTAYQALLWKINPKANPPAEPQKVQKVVALPVPPVYRADLPAPSLLSGLQHFDLLHQEQSGVVLTWSKLSKKGAWKKIKPTDSRPDVTDVLSIHEDQNDRYISANQFHAWRIVAHIKSLRACFVDIDGFTDLHECLGRVTDANLPAPTFSVMSGRGIHLYWAIEPEGTDRLHIWQRTQNEICTRLTRQGLPVDGSAKDCTRVLRLAGSVNSKNGLKVYGHIFSETKFELMNLAVAVLGALPIEFNRPQIDHERALELDIEKEAAAVRDFRAAQVRKGQQPGHAPAGSLKGSIYGWWQLVYRDLIVIGDQLGGIPHHYRDKYLFIYSCALSWFADASALESEVRLVARKLTPGLTAAAVSKAISPNLQRLKDARAGKKVIWNGREGDPRYWFKSSTILEWLEGCVTPDMYPELRAIVPESVLASRRAARYKDSYTGKGVMASNQEKRAQAVLMRSEGKTQKEIADELQVSKMTISRWFKIA